MHFITIIRKIILKQLMVGNLIQIKLKKDQPAKLKVQKKH
jgi:hypothetical protein